MQVSQFCYVEIMGCKTHHHPKNAKGRGNINTKAKQRFFIWFSIEHGSAIFLDLCVRGILGKLSETFVSKLSKTKI